MMFTVRATTVILLIWISSATSRSTPVFIEVENTQATVPEFTTSETIIRARPQIKNHEGLLSQCQYFPTTNLRKLCRKIAENPVIASMKDMVRGNLKKRVWATPVTKSASSFGQTESKCPDYSQPDFQERSLSPWELVPNFDPYRYPQWIPEAKCLCSGCIDMNTGKENSLFASREIRVKVRFLRMNGTDNSSPTFRQCTDKICYPSDEDVSVGCHCTIPEEITSA